MQGRLKLSSRAQRSEDAGAIGYAIKLAKHRRRVAHLRRNALYGMTSVLKSLSIITRLVLVIHDACLRLKTEGDDENPNSRPRGLQEQDLQ